MYPLHDQKQVCEIVAIVVVVVVVVVIVVFSLLFHTLLLLFGFIELASFDARFPSLALSLRVKSFKYDQDSWLELTAIDWKHIALTTTDVFVRVKLKNLFAYILLQVHTNRSSFELSIE